LHQAGVLIYHCMMHGNMKLTSTGYLFRENRMWKFYNMETCRCYVVFWRTVRVMSVCYLCLNWCRCPVALCLSAKNC